MWTPPSTTVRYSSRATSIDGPAIIDQLDSTTVLLPRQRAEVVRFGTIVITVEA